MELDKLVLQNPWWSNREAIKEDDKVKKVLATDERITFDIAHENQVLVGPRQLGKTTALKYDIYKKIIKHGIDPKVILYYSFDTARNFEEISDVIDTFLRNREKEIFLYLDEISFVDDWQRAIKYFLDSGRSSEITMYITGSSSINLKKELMPGRKIKFLEFLPLSFRDFLISFGSKELRHFLVSNKGNNFDKILGIAEGAFPHFREIEKWFAVYINTGGYPDAIFDYIKNGKLSEDLFDIHWNAFVSDVSKADKSVEIATAIVYGLVQSYSTKVNLSSIARMQGIKSHVTVREYIETFDDLFAAKSVFPMSGKKYVFRKERKVYFTDPFLYNLFAKKTNISDAQRESKVVEGILYNHLYRFVNKNRSVAESKTSVGFYSGNKEVDFVIDEFGFESKWQNDVKATDFPQVGIRNKVLLSKKTLEHDKKGNVRILPLSLFLSAI